MTPVLALAEPPATMYRVGRSPDPWAWPDWTYAHEDGTFGNRFDDPLGEYRVLYASERRVGAFAETLARFRPDLEVAAELAEIVGDAADDDYRATLPAGVVPREWLEARLLGSATHRGCLDAGDVRRRIPRAFTQEISRYVFVHARDADGRPAVGHVEPANRCGGSRPWRRLRDVRAQVAVIGPRGRQRETRGARA